MEAELFKDMTPRVELRKQNFMMTYPQDVPMILPPEGRSGSGKHKAITTKAELWKLNFTKSYPQSTIVELQDIISPSAELRNCGTSP